MHTFGGRYNPSHSLTVPSHPLPALFCPFPIDSSLLPLLPYLFWWVYAALSTSVVVGRCASQGHIPGPSSVPPLNVTGAVPHNPEGDLQPGEAFQKAFSGKTPWASEAVVSQADASPGARDTDYPLPRLPPPTHLEPRMSSIGPPKAF